MCKVWERIVDRWFREYEKASRKVRRGRKYKSLGKCDWMEEGEKFKRLRERGGRIRSERKLR